MNSLKFLTTVLTLLGNAILKIRANNCGNIKNS